MSLGSARPAPGTARLAAAEIGIGMVGYAFMGRAHAHGWRTVPRVFDLSVEPREWRAGRR